MVVSFKKAYTFDDVALVPQFNNALSRKEPSLETWLTKNRRIRIPILSANIDTVIGPELAEFLEVTANYMLESKPRR